MSETTNETENADNPFWQKAIAFHGKLGSVTKSEAEKLVRKLGGKVVDVHKAHVIIVGADEVSLSIAGANSPETASENELVKLARESGARVMTETELLAQLGLLEESDSIRRLHTPAMVAALIGAPVDRVRRWHRLGWIRPEREIKRLPYFSFEEVATARRLVELVRAGVSEKVIREQLDQLRNLIPNVDRPLSQLATIIEGKEILVRRDHGLVDASGQGRFDFDRDERESNDAEEPPTISIFNEHESIATLARSAFRDLLAKAAAYEEEGDTAAAIQCYRDTLAMRGPHPETCFLLGDALYRHGDLSAARERLYMTLEMDEEFVEARLNLGCVLLELKELSLAQAAFEGAIQTHPDYADAHYHLARLLDSTGAREIAESHWRRFLELAPDSPWADEAMDRIG